MTEENTRSDLFLTAEIKLYYDIYVPDTAPKPAPLLIAVHGYGAHKRYMMREAKLVAPENFVIASVQAPHQHWREDKGTFKIGFGWLTDHKPEESVALHQKFLLDLIEKLSSDETIDPGEVYLFGFSQACALNFRFAFTHPDSVKGVAGLCGGIPSDLSSNPAYFPTEADILYLFGDEDEFYPLDKFRSYDTKLQNYLPNYTSRQYSATHKITDEMRRDVKNWFAERK